jgi:hypothetical protein
MRLARDSRSAMGAGWRLSPRTVIGDELSRMERSGRRARPFLAACAMSGHESCAASHLVSRVRSSGDGVSPSRLRLPEYQYRIHGKDASKPSRPTVPVAG